VAPPADLTGARIAFAGTPDFAVPCLQMLLDAGAVVPVVLTQPDRPAGRGRRLSSSPVKALAVATGLPVEQPARLADATMLVRHGPPADLLLVVAYGLLLPRVVLDWPGVACINVHASLLPRWRGAAPIQRAILAGDASTGVSIMRMEPGLDTGAVYATASTPVGVDENAAGLTARLSVLGAELARATLPTILGGGLEPRPQSEAAATRAPKLVKAEAVLDWHEPAAVLQRRVRAYNPWPVAEGRLTDGRRLRIWDALAGPPTAAPVGTIIAAGAAGIDVATGDGSLRLVTLQAPGGRAMPASTWAASQQLDGLAFAPA
jgi:methionyl-tRNA formyltransferase